VYVVHARLGPGNRYTFTEHDKDVLKHSDQIYAIVTGIPSDEGVDVYFPYSLKVNGKERADGQGKPAS
jgi:hypothetical protein